MPTMPNLLGMELSGTQAALQSAGVLNLNSIGYFGIWPITVKWQSSPSTKGTITAQSPTSGATVAVNPSINLTVSDFPVGSVYP
jgi:beta-lactam-binding protein with PASTA domain